MYSKEPQNLFLHFGVVFIFKELILEYIPRKWLYVLVNYPTSGLSKRASWKGIKCQKNKCFSVIKSSCNTHHPRTHSECVLPWTIIVFWLVWTRSHTHKLTIDFVINSNFFDLYTYYLRGNPSPSVLRNCNLSANSPVQCKTWVFSIAFLGRKRKSERLTHWLWLILEANNRSRN